MIYDAIIIGGGPSGLMAANVLENNHLSYLLLEKNDQLAKKLLLTGGKRCNVTNNLQVHEFIESLNMKHRRFLYHALQDFGPEDIVQFFKERGLGLLLEQGLKYFPETQKSKSVLDALLQDIDQKHLHMSEAVRKLTQEDNHFIVQTDQNVYHANHVIVATGSKAYPTTGSNGDGIRFAEYMGLKTIPFTPAETHVYSDHVKKDLIDLQGTTIGNATLYIKGQKKAYPGGVLFTHFGLSGPAVLHASEKIAEHIEHGPVIVTFSLSEQDDKDVQEHFQCAIKEKLTVLSFLESILTKRLAKKVIDIMQIPYKNLNEWSKKDQMRLMDLILHFEVVIDRVEVIEKAFVNAGGLSVEELDPQTMMVKRIPGLYFVGETNDLQGPIGGFNLTIAFSTGHLAAKSIVSSLHKEKN
ncbi:MAG TPA: aminoacetone oxidase family FAD-binding enzyme [Acholeplasmataceae bacterium]|nr:aminoacetone oxidase family FAD-binding enzyme [Acholeplasmataceae bacterium]